MSKSNPLANFTLKETLGAEGVLTIDQALGSIFSTREGNEVRVPLFYLRWTQWITIALSTLGSLTGIALRHLCANSLERLVACAAGGRPSAPSHCSSLYLPGRGGDLDSHSFWWESHKDQVVFELRVQLRMTPISCLYFPGWISGWEHCALPAMTVFLNRLDFWAFPPCCKHSEPHYTPHALTLSFCLSCVQGFMLSTHSIT